MNIADIPIAPYVDCAPVTLLIGDAEDRLQDITDGCAQCCVTSPPYFGLRNYGVAGQLGQEATPEEYVGRLVAVFRQVRRCLAADGLLWLNIADTYRDRSLLGVPWMLAAALKHDGWTIRDEVVWHKTNAMPSSAPDRCTPAHERVFMLSRSSHYFSDLPAISEPAVKGAAGSIFHGGKTGSTQRRVSTVERVESDTRNARNVWSIGTQNYKGAHSAVMPSELADRCIRAGSRPGDLILDPFHGAGTTSLAACRLGRRSVGCELNADYVRLSVDRLAKEGFASAVFNENLC